MQAITTYFIPCTNFHGSRIKAKSSSGLSVTLSWEHETDIEDNHERAVRALCAKLGWKGTLSQGALKDGARVWVFVKDHTTITV